ncbi:MAG: hypothetical protein M5U01_39150 [Ardenticatenaceae bacterium]|nr:hypothetical protein [Ardenticatenaceae bacterium]
MTDGLARYNLAALAPRSHSDGTTTEYEPVIATVQTPTALTVAREGQRST